LILGVGNHSGKTVTKTTMEAFLPKDMIREVMKYLTNEDLTMYGQSSKITLESSEDEWRMRYNGLEVEKKEHTDANPLVYWLKNYSVNISENFRNKFASILKQFQSEYGRRKKLSILVGMFDIILNNRLLLFGNNKFKKFRETVDMKLEEFLNGHESECEIAVKYYPVLFPQSYLVALNKKINREQMYLDDE
jgi:hypothetical protein